MTSSSKTTTDHKEIQKWAESRGGKPVTVRRTGDKAAPGVLRIDFPGGAGDETFEDLSWDDWFAKFEENDLALLYQDHKADGSESTFFKLVKREGDTKPKSKEQGK